MNPLSTMIRNRCIAACLATALLAVTWVEAPRAQTTWEPPYIGSDTALLYLPDANATYWRYGIERSAGDAVGFVVRGLYPDARYFSYNVYDDSLKQSVGSITDYEIVADEGSVNPFTGVGGTGGTYTLYIVPEGSVVNAPNVITFPSSLENVSVFLRHYLPEGGIEGGVGVPEIALFDAAANQLLTTPPSNAVPSLSKQEAKRYLLPMFEKMAEQFKANPDAMIAQFEARDRSKPLDIKALVAKQVVSGTFSHVRPGEVLDSYNFQTDGTYPNKDNLYLVMPVIRTGDEALLVKFRAPEFARTPDQYPNAPVRYFSIGQGDDVTYNFITATDRDMIIGPDGMIRLIISDDNAAMRAKAESLGANFMPWRVGEKMLLVYRHMLPRADFAYGIDKVPAFDKTRPAPEQAGHVSIGDYAPTGLLVDEGAVLAADSFPQF